MLLYTQLAATFKTLGCQAMNGRYLLAGAYWSCGKPLPPLSLDGAITAFHNMLTSDIKATVADQAIVASSPLLPTAKVPTLSSPHSHWG
jgi:hypothetical protein